MNVWHMAFDAWNKIDHDPDLTTDQRIHLSQTLALLSIGQELSQIHHNGVNPEFKPGSD